MKGMKGTARTHYQAIWEVAVGEVLTCTYERDWGTLWQVHSCSKEGQNNHRTLNEEGVMGLWLELQPASINIDLHVSKCTDSKKNYQYVCKNYFVYKFFFIVKISRYTVTTTQYSMAFYCACVYGNGMIVLLYISYSVFN